MKEKGRKRSKPACRWTAVEYGSIVSKARKLCAKACLQHTFRLTSVSSPLAALCPTFILWKPRAMRRVHRRAWEIPTVLFSPQWAFTKLGGAKISYWGSNRPVSAPKEKPPHDLQVPKEQRAAKHPFAKRTVCHRHAFAQSRAGFAVYNFHTRRRSTCKVA